MESSSPDNDWPSGEEIDEFIFEALDDETRRKIHVLWEHDLQFRDVLFERALSLSPFKKPTGTMEDYAEYVEMVQPRTEAWRLFFDE